MILVHLGFFFLVFVVISYIAFLFIASIMIERSINHRLNSIRSRINNGDRALESQYEISAKKLMARLIGFSRPNEKWETSPLRLKMIKAGYGSELNGIVFFIAKTLLTFIIPLILLPLFPLFGQAVLSLKGFFILIAGAGFGYYLPELWLQQKVSRRQKELSESLPNALDLMRVCVNAGLGLDAAIDRVGRELQIESQALADEFHTLTVELRTGATRDLALRNLAARTGLEDVNALVSMLIQTERFGTSVGEALRVHAEGLRTKRNMRAQEAAAKIPAKLTLPMILCIFPALMVVVLGPAIISIGKTLLPMIHQVGH